MMKEWIFAAVVHMNHLSIDLSVYLSIYLSGYLSIHLSIYGSARVCFHCDLVPAQRGWSYEGLWTFVVPPVFPDS